MRQKNPYRGNLVMLGWSALMGIAFILGLTFILGVAFGTSVKAADYKIEKIVTDLDSPWGLAILPQGDMLITQLSGKLRLIRNGKLVNEPVRGVPESYYASQGGLMDIVLHPDYVSNQLVYLSLAVGTPDANALRVIRGRFNGTALEDVQTVFEATPTKDTPAHYGGRMAFLADKSLLITVGDGFDYREQAQNLNNHFGTIVRVTDSGKVPADNPFVGRDEVQPEIWSYGHRNAQSIIFDKKTKQVFQTEHGPRGGDELNLIEAGKNYGWPIATFGLDYSGARVSPHSAYEGTIQPLVYWTPSIAPSGMTLYRGTQFPQWDGDIFITSLVFNNVVRVDMAGGQVVRREVLFPEIAERIRDIRTGRDGALYILSEGKDDEGGKLWRVSANR